MIISRKISGGLMNKENAIEVRNMTKYFKVEYDKAHTLKESEYTPNSYAQFKKVLSNAQKVYDNENATQEEVQEVEKTLKDAIEKLVLKANKTEQRSLIENKEEEK